MKKDESAPLNGLKHLQAKTLQHVCSCAGQFRDFRPFYFNNMSSRLVQGKYPKSTFRCLFEFTLFIYVCSFHQKLALDNASCVYLNRSFIKLLIQKITLNVSHKLGQHGAIY